MLSVVKRTSAPHAVAILVTPAAARAQEKDIVDTAVAAGSFTPLASTA